LNELPGPPPGLQGSMRGIAVFSFLSSSRINLRRINFRDKLLGTAEAIQLN
jgi:hypothetical protein